MYILLIIANIVLAHAGPRFKGTLNRTRLTFSQLYALEDSFAKDPCMSIKRSIELARQIGWNGKGVYEWFRRKLKRTKFQEKNSTGEFNVPVQ